MKKVLSLLLCVCLMAGLFAGCASENTPYVPTGDALLPEDADLDALESEKETAPQELSLVYYADRSMNPLSCTDFTNRVLFSLIYQGLFSVSSSNDGGQSIKISSYSSLSGASASFSIYSRRSISTSSTAAPESAAPESARRMMPASRAVRSPCPQRFSI